MGINGGVRATGHNEEESFLGKNGGSEDSRPMACYWGF